jgi:hypothetical protein
MHHINQKDYFDCAIKNIENKEYILALNKLYQLKTNKFNIDEISAYIGFTLYKLKNYKLAKIYITQSIAPKKNCLKIGSRYINLNEILNIIKNKRPVNRFISSENIYKVDIYTKYLKNEGCKILSAREIYSKLKTNSHKTCHVIGSGWSLKEGMHKIKKNDFVMGFNFAAYADLIFDFYFIELCGFSNDILKKNSVLQLNLVKNYISKNTKNIILKNLWEDKNDIELISQIYKKNIYIVKDYLLNAKGLTNKEFVNHLLKKDDIYLKQAYSTSITCIITAFHSGFKKIVLHGIDFVGPHFFNISNFTNSKKIPIPTVNYRSGILSKNGKKEKLIIAGPGIYGQTNIMRQLYDTLKKNGVELFTASTSSPSSQFLPVYR